MTLNGSNVHMSVVQSFKCDLIYGYMSRRKTSFELNIAVL